MNKVNIKITFIISLLIIGYLTINYYDFSFYFFPNPLDVIKVWIKNRKIIFHHSLVTIIESFLGFLIANSISFVIALFLSFYRKFEKIVIPLAIWLKTMPIIAVIPLLILWFGSGISSKIMASALVCFFPTLVNVLRGIKSLDEKLFWLFKLYSATKMQLIEKLILPSILPYLFSAFKTSSSLAIVGALVGEFLGSNKGLGFLIVSNYYNLNIPFVFAAVLTSSFIGISFYYLLELCEKRIITESIDLKI